LYKECPKKEGRMRNVHHIQKETTIEDVGRNIRRIYVALENQHVQHQSNMIEVEGKIVNQPITISSASHSYIAPNLVERFHLERIRHEKSWLAQWLLGLKGRLIRIVKGYPLNMHGVKTELNTNNIPLGSYDVFIGMD
jgi:hypothetical protein